MKFIKDIKDSTWDKKKERIGKKWLDKVVTIAIKFERDQ